MFSFATVSAADDPSTTLEKIPEPIIQADSAILIESSTGRVIFEKNADEKRPPASMTKMMTCILGLENLTKRTQVLISETAAYTEDNTFYWTPGDIIHAEDINLGMMLVSDNGAAVAIAQSISGTIPLFSRLMNHKAKLLGCTDTNFVNPNGLPNENHYSTARDMARIAMYGMTIPDFRDIVSTKKAIIRWQSPADKFAEAENTNELLDKYEGMNGIKTGWTRAAGGCLAASAIRGDTELIAIIMHSTDMDTRFDDARKLLDYGFKRVKMTKTINRDRVEKVVFVRDGERATIHVRPMKDLNFPLLDGENPKKLKVNYDLPKIVDAAIKKGDIVGNAQLKYNDKVLSSVPLIADETVNKGFSITSTLVGFMEPVIDIAQSIVFFFA
ncbi:MAG: D-alanyl-D-alanine carboxypeptidase [Selenomonadaceae bacterium]|nr:D-alanyl-D-alanine carboxypeptidase [Selenomonadaceae bacterium]